MTATLEMPVTVAITGGLDPVVVRFNQGIALQLLLAERPNIEGLALEGHMEVEPINMAQGCQIIDEAAAALVARYENRRNAHRAQEKNLDGSMFECDDCDEGISLKRIVACPTAVRCTKCQDRIERSHGNYYLVYSPYGHGNGK